MVGTNRVKKLSKRERVLLTLGNETQWSLLIFGLNCLGSWACSHGRQFKQIAEGQGWAPIPRISGESANSITTPGNCLKEAFLLGCTAPLYSVCSAAWHEKSQAPLSDKRGWGWVLWKVLGYFPRLQNHVYERIIIPSTDSSLYLIYIEFTFLWVLVNLWYYLFRCNKDCSNLWYKMKMLVLKGHTF